MRKVKVCAVAGAARTGKGEWSASKSACFRPSGSDGGHALCCFGVVAGLARFPFSRPLPSSSTALLRLLMPLFTGAGRCVFVIFLRCAVVRFSGASSIGLSSLGGAGRDAEVGSAVRKDWRARQDVKMLEVDGFGEVGCDDGGGENRRKGGK